MLARCGPTKRARLAESPVKGRPTTPSVAAPSSTWRPRCRRSARWSRSTP